MGFEIIDVHAHPFTNEKNNICQHPDFAKLTKTEDIKALYDSLGVSKICGSVVEPGSDPDESAWDKIIRNNRDALKLKEILGDFYVPGFHVHPDFVDESIAEMRFMHSQGIKLVGELTPKMYGWETIICDGFMAILDEAARLGMVVNLHTYSHDDLDKLANMRKDVIFLIAHPGEPYGTILQSERMKKHDNFYLETSGYGLHRHGVLRNAIDTAGEDRILFASGFPTYNPSMYIGAVTYDPYVKDSEKEKILSLNAKKLLGL